MKRPPLGLTVPVNFIRARDGDTVLVRLPHSEYEWAVRLLDCWVKDGSNADKQAKARIEQICQGNGDLALFVPIPVSPSDHPLTNIVKALFTFDRVLGYLFVSDGGTINELLVEEGLATTTKKGQ